MGGWFFRIKALGQVPDVEFEVLPPLSLLPLQSWVLLPKSRDVRFHERAEVWIGADPGLQPPHARARAALLLATRVRQTPSWSRMNPRATAACVTHA